MSATPSDRQRRLGPWEINEVHVADSRDALNAVPPESFDVVVTSPPYWGQRESLGIGTEEDPRDYVADVVSVLAATMRCLKRTGTLWLNMGDAYNTPVNWRPSDRRYSTLGKDGSGLEATNSAYTKRRARRRAFIDRDEEWLQYGNLLSLPHRVIHELMGLGFLFRGEVIWRKSKPMPEGVCRRPHRHHEGVYILAVDERHHFTTRPAVPSVWDLVQTPNRTSHCSTFPVDLPLKCIQAAGVDRPGVIFDPFMGSGTTAVAAQMLRHDYLGFEIDEEIAAMARVQLNGPIQRTLVG